MNVGLYNLAQKQIPIVNYYLKGGTDTDPSDGNKMYDQLPLDDTQPGSFEWSIKPVKDTIYYIIEANGNFKYKYLSVFTHPDISSWVNVTDAVTVNELWTITKSTDKDNSGNYYYIIKNKSENQFLCNNENKSIDICKESNLSNAWWYIMEK